MSEEGGPPRFLPMTLIQWFDLMVKVGAIFAAAFAVHQWLQAREDARVARTLDYVARFEDPERWAGVARQRITTALWNNESQLDRLEAAMSRMPREDAEAIRRRFIWKIVEGTPEAPGLRDAIDEIVFFFHALKLCIDARLCDRAAAKNYFGQYAETIWWNFGDFIRVRRGRDPTYGLGLQEVAAASSHDATGLSP